MTPEPRACRYSGAEFKTRLNHPAVESCENDDEGGLDTGRYFVHLIFAGWNYDEGYGRQMTFSCGSLTEARKKLRNVTKLES
jgi:hypothetical protein